MRKFILFCFSVFLCVGLSAGNGSYSGGLEFGFGPSMGVFKVKGETRSALGSSEGSNCYLRYTHYIKKDGFGVYGEVRGINASSYEYRYFGAMNKADGGKYRYRFSGNEYDQGYSPLLSLGGAYRMQYKVFDLVFRAGLGYGERYNDFDYDRQSRDGSTGPEYFSVEVAGASNDAQYLLQDDYSYTYYSAPAFVFGASAQFVLKTKGRWYFFGEAGFDCSPSKYDVSVTKISSKKYDEPSNWVEAVARYELKDVWMTDYSSKNVSSAKFGMGSHLSFSIGVGINLWKI